MPMRTRTRVWAYMALAACVAVVVIATVIGITVGVLTSQDNGGGNGGGTKPDDGGDTPTDPSSIGSYNDPTGLIHYWDTINVVNSPAFGNNYYSLLTPLVGGMSLDANFGTHTVEPEFGQGPQASTFIKNGNLGFCSSQQWDGNNEALDDEPLSVVMWVKLQPDWASALVADGGEGPVIRSSSSFCGTFVDDQLNGGRYGWRLGFSTESRTISVEFYDGSLTPFASLDYYAPAASLEYSDFINWYNNTDGLSQWTLYSFSYVSGVLTAWRGCGAAATRFGPLTVSGNLVGEPVYGHGFCLGQDQIIAPDGGKGWANVMTAGRFGWLRIYSRMLTTTDLGNLCAKPGVFVAHYIFSNRSTAARTEDRADWWYGRKHNLLTPGGTTNTLIFTYDSAIGNALQCGQNSFLRYVAKSALELTTPPMSVGFWFKLPTTITKVQTLISGGYLASAVPSYGQGEAAWEVTVNSDYQLTLSIQNNVEVWTLPNVFDTEWHHFTFSVSDQSTDGTSGRKISVLVDCGAPTIRTYTAAKWKQMFTGPLLYDVSVAQTHSAIFMCRNMVSWSNDPLNTTNLGYFGQLADVRIYNGVVSDESHRTNCNLDLVLHFQASARVNGITDQARTVLVPTTDVLFYRTNTLSTKAVYSVWGSSPACLYWSTRGPAYALSQPSGSIPSIRGPLSARVTTYDFDTGEMTLMFWMRTFGAVGQFQTLFSTRVTKSFSTPQIPGSLKGFNMYINMVNYSNPAWAIEGNKPYDGWLSFWWSQCGNVTKINDRMTHGWRKMHIVNLNSGEPLVGKFFHVAVVYSNAQESVKAYINGDLQVTADKDSIGYWPKICPSNNSDPIVAPFSMGRASEFDTTTTAWPFLGDMGDVRLYSKAVSTGFVSLASQACMSV